MPPPTSQLPGVLPPSFCWDQAGMQSLPAALPEKAIPPLLLTPARREGQGRPRDLYSTAGFLQQWQPRVRPTKLGGGCPLLPLLLVQAGRERQGQPQHLCLAASFLQVQVLLSQTEATCLLSFLLAQHQLADRKGSSHL